MPAYLIIYNRVSDPARFGEYGRAVVPLIERMGGRLAALDEPTVVEGAFDWEHAAVFEWPSKEAALRFWNSPEYRDVHRLREGAAEFQAVVVEGAGAPASTT